MGTLRPKRYVGSKIAKPPPTTPNADALEEVSKRVRIAKAMGLDYVPDPFTSAADACALRMWLVTEGWEVEESWRAYGYAVEIWNRDTEIHIREDCDIDLWKRWFTEAALKAIERAERDVEIT